MNSIAWHRLRQRKLVQWAAAYLAGSWVVLQVLALLSNTYGWPPAFMRVVPVALSVGFFGLLVIVWYHGEQGRQRVSGPELTILAALFLLGGGGIWFAAGGRSLAATAVGASVPAAFRLELPTDLELTTAGSAGLFALSGDGSTLVFQATPRGSSVPALYVRRLDDPSVHLIRGTENGRLPALSADGTDLLFLDGNVLKHASVREGKVRVVVANAAPASWLDGEHIVFGGLGWGGSGLFTVAAEGGAPSILASPDSTRNHVQYGFPSVLPGGREALITIWEGAPDPDSTWLGVVAIPGGKVTELGIRGTSPRYSPSGHIVYATAENILLAVPFSARSQRVTGVPVTVAQGVPVGVGGAAAFAIAQNGTLVYLNSTSPAATTLVAVSRSGTERPLLTEPGRYYTPRFSPDGRRIAMTIAGSLSIFGSLITNVRHPDAWMLDLPSGVLNRLTTDSASSFPSWVPGGDRLAYRHDGIVRVLGLHAGAEPASLIRTPSRIFSVSFGRADGYLSLEVRQPSGTNTTADVWTAHMDSMDAPRLLVAAPYREHDPHVSPDGRLLAYTSNRTGDFEVYMRPIVGAGEEIRVSAAGGAEPVWAPDSREIFYRAPQHLISARIADGPRLEIAARDTLFYDSYLRMIEIGNYDVSPNGSEFVMVKEAAQPGAGHHSALILLNWTPTGQALPPQGR